MRPVIDHLKSRWDPRWDTKYAGRKREFELGLFYAAGAAEKHKELAEGNKGNWTERGLAENFRKHVIDSGVAAKIKQSLATASRVAEQMALRRAALGTFTYDKTDVVAALQRREMRDYVKSITDRGAKLKLLNANKALAEAVFEMAPEFSGVDEEIFVLAKDTYVRTYKAAELAEIDEIEDIEATVGTAWEVAANSVISEAVFGETYVDRKWFDDIAA